MGYGVLIVGASGSGKTTGIRTLDPKSTFILNSDKKPLPFPGYKKMYQTVRSGGQIDWDKSNYYETNDVPSMIKVLQFVSDKRQDIDTVVIDTINHVMTAKTMAEAGIKGFEKWSNLAVSIYNLISLIPNLRDDLTVFVLGHDDRVITEEGETVRKLATAGKSLDKINIESLMTTVLFSDNRKVDDKITYQFRTKTDGRTTAKTPIGMFSDEELFIPNDFKLIKNRVKSYYEGTVEA